MKPLVFVRLTNQLNTTDPLLAQLRYARRVKRLLHATARYGTPDFVHALKNLGAFPVMASEYSDRLDRYRKEFPLDQALIMMLGEGQHVSQGYGKHKRRNSYPAFMMESKTGIPAFLIPMTNADDPAPAPPSVSAGSFDGARMPMDSTQPM